MKYDLYDIIPVVSEETRTIDTKKTLLHRIGDDVNCVEYLDTVCDATVIDDGVEVNIVEFITNSLMALARQKSAGQNLDNKWFVLKRIGENRFEGYITSVYKGRANISYIYPELYEICRDIINYTKDNFKGEDEGSVKVWSINDGNTEFAVKTITNDINHTFDILSKDTANGVEVVIAICQEQNILQLMSGDVTELMELRKSYNTFDEGVFLDWAIDICGIAQSVLDGYKLCKSGLSAADEDLIHQYSKTHSIYALNEIMCEAINCGDESKIAELIVKLLKKDSTLIEDTSIAEGFDSAIRKMTGN